MSKCARCDGSGSIECPQCHGKGKSGGQYIPIVTEVTGVGEDSECAKCDGTGETACPVCGGSGQV